MLKAAERMMVPRHFLYESHDVHMLKALLGVKDPSEMSVDAFGKAVNAIAPPIATLAKSGLDVAKEARDVISRKP